MNSVVWIIKSIGNKRTQMPPAKLMNYVVAKEAYIKRLTLINNIKKIVLTLSAESLVAFYIRAISLRQKENRRLANYQHLSEKLH